MALRRRPWKIVHDIRGLQRWSMNTHIGLRISRLLIYLVRLGIKPRRRKNLILLTTNIDSSERPIFKSESEQQSQYRLQLQCKESVAAV